MRSISLALLHADYGQIVIHFFAQPAALGGARRDPDALPAVIDEQGLDVPAGTSAGAG